MIYLPVIICGIIAVGMLLEVQSFRSPTYLSQIRKLPTRTLSPSSLHGPTSLQSLPPTIFDVSPASLGQQAVTAAAVNLPIATTLLLSGQKSLTKAGLFHATLLGLGLWSYLGVKGWLIGVIYFVLGSVVTKIRMNEKEVLQFKG